MNVVLFKIVKLATTFMTSGPCVAQWGGPA